MFIAMHWSDVAGDRTKTQLRRRPPVDRRTATPESQAGLGELPLSSGPEETLTVSITLGVKSSPPSARSS